MYTQIRQEPSKASGMDSSLLPQSPVPTTIFFLMLEAGKRLMSQRVLVPFLQTCLANLFIALFMSTSWELGVHQTKKVGSWDFKKLISSISQQYCNTPLQIFQTSRFS